MQRILFKSLLVFFLGGLFGGLPALIGICRFSFVDSKETNESDWITQHHSSNLRPLQTETYLERGSSDAHWASDTICVSGIPVWYTGDLDSSGAVTELACAVGPACGDVKARDDASFLFMSGTALRAAIVLLAGAEPDTYLTYSDLDKDGRIDVRSEYRGGDPIAQWVLLEDTWLLADRTGLMCMLVEAGWEGQQRVFCDGRWMEVSQCG